MPRTPDRMPGPSQEEELRLEDNGAAPSVDGAITFNGGAFQMRDSVGTFDPRSGGSGITETQHKNLDQLVHLIAEGSFEEYIYTGNRVDQIIVWTDAGKTTKIREELYTYTGSQLTTLVTKQYDGAGTLVQTLTETYSYTGSKLDDITRVLS